MALDLTCPSSCSASWPGWRRPCFTRAFVHSSEGQSPSASARLQKVSDSFTAGAKDRYHEELLAQVDTRHIARALFRLSDILITPRLLIPPPRIDPSQAESQSQDTLSVLPNLPDWNFLSAVYQSLTMGLEEALQQGTDLLITGELGSGKSTALAYLAGRLVDQRVQFGGKGYPLPVLIHAADLIFESNFERDPLRTLTGAVQRTASAGLSSRLTGYLKPYFDQGHMVVLLDGLDEFPADGLGQITNWLAALKGKSPHLKIVAAGPVYGYDGLTHMGFAPMALAPWNDYDQRQFLARWGAAWQAHVAPNLPKNRLDEVDPTLVSGWLLGTSPGWTPLAFTLRTWASFVGNSHGASRTAGFEAYLARFLSPDETQAAAAAGLAWISAREGAVEERNLRRGTPVGDLETAGIVIRRPGNRVSFVQPGIGAYLAAKAMTEAQQAPPLDIWAPAEAAAAYHAGLADVSEMAGQMLESGDDQLRVRRAQGWPLAAFFKSQGALAPAGAQGARKAHPVHRPALRAPFAGHSRHGRFAGRYGRRVLQPTVDVGPAQQPHIGRSGVGRPAARRLARQAEGRRDR